MGGLFMSEAENTKPGQARSPGLTVQEILAKDSRPVPEYLTSQSYEFLGDQDLPFTRYTSKDFHEKEIERIPKNSKKNPRHFSGILKNYKKFKNCQHSY